MQTESLRYDISRLWSQLQSMENSPHRKKRDGASSDENKDRHHLNTVDVCSTTAKRSAIKKKTKQTHSVTRERTGSRGLGFPCVNARLYQHLTSSWPQHFVSKTLTNPVFILRVYLLFNDNPTKRFAVLNHFISVFSRDG